MSTLTQLYGKPLVKPGNIETELEKIYSAAASQDAAEEKAATGAAAPRTKATLSNLVLINTSASTDEVDASINNLIDKLCESYPSRFFVLDANLPAGASPGGTGVATAVSSRCFLAESGAHVCSEEIYMSVENRALPLVKNLLMSLFAPDVDVVVVLLGDAAVSEHAESVEKILSALLPVANRIVYDSSGFREYGRTLRLLATAGRESSAAYDLNATLGKLADVNWRRTRQWRSMISESFNAERLAEAAPKMNRLSLVCQRTPAELQAGKIPPDALLLAGWVATSLGKSLQAESYSKSDSGVVFRCDGGGEALRVECVGEPSPKWKLADVSLRSVELASSGSEKLRIERDPESGTAVISALEANRNCAYHTLPLDELVLSRIVSHDPDAQFLQSLKLSIVLAESGQLN